MRQDNQQALDSLLKTAAQVVNHKVKLMIGYSSEYDWYTFHLQMPDADPFYDSVLASESTGPLKIESWQFLVENYLIGERAEQGSLDNISQIQALYDRIWHSGITDTHHVEAVVTLDGGSDQMLTLTLSELTEPHHTERYTCSVSSQSPTFNIILAEWSDRLEALAA